jgi:aconitate hydratase
MKIDLAALGPLAAQPHSPDAVAPIQALRGLRVQQVVIGSCTNSSLADLVAVAGMLAGKKVHPEVSLVISPGSQQVLAALAKNGALRSLIAAGARTLEPACGACIGMGQAPASDAVTLRTFNRNFKGRSGTPDARVYLVSPESAAAAALTGEITDPRTVKGAVKFFQPVKADVSDSLLVYPPKTGEKVEIRRGPNIAPLPEFSPLPDEDAGLVLLKVGDNVTTDDILPAGAKILPLRSNIPAIARHVFSGLDPEFRQRALAAQGGYIVGGENYGQGSSREHAALAPRHLGVRAVLAKSFARIHLANLINFGILPLTFQNQADYDRVSAGDALFLPELKKHLLSGEPIRVKNQTTGTAWEMQAAFSARQMEILQAGGFLNWLKNSAVALKEL